jgi:transcription elongation factor GreA
MEREVVLTEEGYKKLQEELDQLSTVRRREVAERIKEAREFGDISENSEYEDAKNEQAMVEGRILHLESQLRNARVVDVEHVSTESVSIGVRVTIKDVKGKKNLEYKIVGAGESDPRKGMISNESPVGRALIGHKKGDKVTVPTAKGAVQYQVVKIEAGEHGS